MTWSERRTDTTAKEHPEGVVPGGSAPSTRYPCGQCGAEMEYRPGSTALTCGYCGSTAPIPEGADAIRELDYRQQLAELAAAEPVRACPTLTCEACGAQLQRDERVTATACPFCGSQLIAGEACRSLVPPRSLLPFQVDRDLAWSQYRAWVTSRWFAPTKLRRFARGEGRLQGMYVPHWTFDCDGHTVYAGQRGDDYWTTVQRDGKTATRVRRTRWSSVSGAVSDHFDDVLVVASRSLPQAALEQLGPWDLEHLVPFAEEYLAGFIAENYQIDLEAGFEVARETIDREIRNSVNRDIGGDHQRITTLQTQYESITFKHLLLPVWVHAYAYRGKVYQLLINARTGEVQGERPWSWVKIALACLAAAAVVAVIVVVTTLR